MNSDCHVVLVAPMQAIHVSSGEHLGIGYLAASLRQHGYRVEIVDGWLEQLSPQEVAGRIVSRNPSLCVGFSAYISNIDSVRETIRWLRSQKVACACVVGGYGPTFHPDEFLRCGADVVVRGEGDVVLSQLCSHFRSGAPCLSELRGVSYVDQRRHIKHNAPSSVHVALESLPFPARDSIHLTIEHKNPINVLSSKGCMGLCTFCSIQTFERLANGPPWRQRGLTDFVDELEELVLKYRVSHIKVVDDSLIEPPRDGEWCGRLADEIEKRNLRLRMRGSIRANRVTDDVLSELRRAGFLFLSCGIENFAPTALRRIGKGLNPEDNVRALELFRKHGLYMDSGYILFDDQTTLDELRQNHVLMQRYSWTVGKVFTEMYASRDTPFTKRLQRQRKIVGDSYVLGNYRYPIRDGQAAAVYEGLKTWSRLHGHLYDMATDPLRGFRVMADEALASFHRLYIELHERELEAFGLVLGWVEDGMAPATIDKQVHQHFEDTQGWYEECECRLKELYRINDLRYDSGDNPYL